MIDFAWPWFALLFLLPLLIWLLVPATVRTDKGSALKVPDLARFRQMQAGLQRSRKPQTRHWLALLLWCLLVAAAMRPQWLGEPLAMPTSGRDLMLGVDISGSMREEDFRYAGRFVSRLDVVKELGREFIERRQGDRIGLILFGEQAYVQTPLTYDRKTVQHFLGEAVVGLAGKSTAIGDAIGLSLKRLRKRPQESRVLILLTDGANTAGNVAPGEAASLSKQLGVKIYTIGVGSDDSLNRGMFGFPFGGRTSDLDEDALIEIAEKTGGRYFRARNTEQMEEIYELIDELEPTDDQGRQFRPMRELFSWPLGAAFLMACGWLFVATGRRG